ncbi:MAG: LysM peptidoglycan-binding domain-containing protein [Saprospiraceae bacterium]
MIRLLFSLLAGPLFAVAALAQTQVYILDQPTCMNRLEYKRQGKADAFGLITYTVSPDANQLYMFELGTESGQKLAAAPRSAITCQSPALGDALVRNINAGTIKAYFLRPADGGGYWMSAIGAAMQVVRAGSSYVFRGHNYGFTLDTTNLSYDHNLATPESKAYVFHNGRNMDDCHPVYTFRREPDQVCTTKSDFDFMPGLGILSERTGATAAEAAENEFRLVSINGVAYADYVRLSCEGKTPKRTSTPAPTTPPQAVTYGTTTPPQQNVARNITEPDKEAAAAQAQNPQPQTAPAPAEYATKPSTPVAVGPRPPINCPEGPGEGYHIVQPGETLMAIARGYRVKLGSLVAWNDLDNPDLLVPCQKIYITPPPGGVKTPKDKTTGKVAIATKPTSKTTSKSGKSGKKAAPAPATYATTTKPQATEAPAVIPQATAPVIQYVYVPVPSPCPVPAATTATAPATYAAVESAPAPVTYGTEQPALVAKQAVQPLVAPATIVHTVRPGESLYSIAQLYGFTAERFRKMNGLPENFVLQPGMELVTSDCTCDPTTGRPMQPATYSRPAANPAALAPTTSNAPQTTGNQVFEEQLVSANNQPAQPAKTAEAVPANFREHTVQAGETLGSIANRYGVSAEKIADTNSLEKTETLIVGMRLLVPRD